DSRPQPGGPACRRGAWHLHRGRELPAARGRRGRAGAWICAGDGQLVRRVPRGRWRSGRRHLAGHPAGSRSWRFDFVSSNEARFAGKGVVVTGAAQGIGRAVAKAFAAEGAGVVMLDNEGDVLEQTAKAIRESGGVVEAVVGDVSRREDVRKVVELAIAHY